MAKDLFIRKADGVAVVAATGAAIAWEVQVEFGGGGVTTPPRTMMSASSCTNGRGSVSQAPIQSW